MNYKLLLVLLFTSFTLLPIAAAHTVKIAGDVGGTIHIEPNDNPRAGETAQTWFALTRKGGQVLPLKECNCQLAIYAEPHTPGEPALLEPPLKPVDAERYLGIPGAEITFPKPGVYELQLSGNPLTAGNFRPFELKFQVTVATGKAVPAAGENVIETNQQQAEIVNFTKPIIIVAIILLSIGIVLFLVQAVTRQ
ncbi:hypothetical protein A0J48_018765 [Sphaerospermopsis aphanizomenoides BCCUSP55]|uniref:hypothetical protein n=1 Tax=Sphaerospermopsis aphanizomenoides TaxID=459663 RepID=UPI001903E1F5|nr:hypothetical protein [Sphaerospermopsis aphanizomenoides]MBK1989551.1 hypothetical protein [Sphaerospermopsis aphanizomenoides BCCUSP55]